MTPNSVLFQRPARTCSRTRESSGKRRWAPLRPKSHDFGYNLAPEPAGRYVSKLARRDVNCPGRRCAPILAAYVTMALLTSCAGPPTVSVNREPRTEVTSSKTPGWAVTDSLTVAVLPFARSDDPMEPNYGWIEKRGEEEMRTRFERELVAIPGIKVVDRGHVQDILRTQSLQMSPLFDERTAVELGKLLPARAALFGQIRRYAIVPHQIGPHSATVHVAEVEFTVTLADLETGRILWRATHRGTARRFLPRRRETFEVDPAGPRIRETEQHSKAMLADLRRLADHLVKETVAALGEQ